MKFSWKKSFLVICKILGLFFNTLTDDDNYSFRKKANLTQPIQMQLSQTYMLKALKQCLNLNNNKFNIFVDQY